MKPFLLLAVAALLSGCGSDGDSWIPGHPFAHVFGEEQPAPLPESRIDEDCKAVAHQRASDAKLNGFSEHMADEIYKGTYESCVKWEAGHLH